MKRRKFGYVLDDESVKFAPMELDAQFDRVIAEAKAFKPTGTPDEKAMQAFNQATKERFARYMGVRNRIEKERLEKYGRGSSDTNFVDQCRAMTTKEFAEIGCTPNLKDFIQLFEATVSPGIHVAGFIATEQSRIEFVKRIEEMKKETAAARKPAPKPRAKTVPKAKTRKLGTEKTRERVLKRLVKTTMKFPTGALVRADRVISDGTRVLVGNGQFAVEIAEPDRGGTVEVPVQLNPDTFKGKTTSAKAGLFSGMDAMFRGIAKASVIAKAANTDDLLALADFTAKEGKFRKRDKGSVELFKNKDGSIGGRIVLPDEGETEFNVSPDAEFVTQVNPVLLQNIICAARGLGHEMLSIRVKDHESPVGFQAEGFRAFLMPIRI